MDHVGPDEAVHAPRVLVVDDHAVVRRGLVQIVSDALGDARFVEAATVDEALASLGREGWELALVDLHLPRRDGPPSCATCASDTRRCRCSP